MIENKKLLLMFSNVFLMAVLLFGAFIPALAAGEIDDPSIVEENAMAWLDNIDRLFLREDDMNSYSWLIFIDLINCFPKVLVADGEDGGNKEVVVYPDEYAGAFIDEDNRLHIVLTKPVGAETKYNYRAITGYDETVIFDIAEYSLSYLYDVQKVLDGVMAEFGIESTSLNEFVNRLEVGLVDRTKEGVVVEFLKAKFDGFDGRCLIFKDPVGIVLTAANTANNALSGSKVTYATGTDYGSFGFSAYDKSSGVYGVITAAHVATSGTTIYNAMGTQIGVASKRNFSNTVDAAFVPFPSGMSPSYNYYTSSTPVFGDFLTGYCTNSIFVSGLTVNTLGNRTGHKTGTLTSASDSYTIKIPSGFPNPPTVDLKFTDQLKFSNGVLGGDSGGVIYHQIWSGTTLYPPINLIAGIVTAGDDILNLISLNGYGPKVENIMSVLNIGLYTYSPTHKHVSSIAGTLIHGYGAVSNPNGLIGSSPDGSFVHLYGGNGGDGGHVVGQMSAVSSGDIWVYAYSGNGYYTHFYTFVSYNNNNDWTQTKVQTVVGSGGGPQWINCGSSSNGFRYIGLAGFDDNGMSASIYIDAVIVA
jgi:hypothetical protein